MRRLRSVAAQSLTIAAVIAAIVPVHVDAQGAAASPSAAVDDRCSLLIKSDMSGLKGAPTRITSARLISGEGGIDFCDVRAYVAPQVGIGIRLPAQGWNGKLLLLGCGGYCGVLTIDAPYNQAYLKRGYAIATTDMGHSATPLDAKWAYGNLQGKLDFAYRATHVATIVAKAVVGRYYGKGQDRSYFYGCSTGGRQGLMEAQRFPDDFDGIVVGAPALHYTTSSFSLIHAAQSNIDANGHQILKLEDLPLLNAAAVKACDGIDGLKDGIVGDYRQCRFDPAVLTCKPGQAGQCLTPEKVAAARKIYTGPLTPRGSPIHIGSFPYGSELAWKNRVVGADDKPGYNLSWMTDRFRYLAYTLDPGPLWTIGDLDWTDDPNRAGGLGEVYSADNPDLRAYKARGGRIIHFQGWQDPSVAPMQSVDYYDMAARAMGGLAQTQSFYRLFTMPGVEHCVGGPGADKADWLEALENWVERGQAPERIVGAHVEKGATTLTRPYFPYPDFSRYAGKGDVRDAANFLRVKGEMAP